MSFAVAYQARSIEEALSYLAADVEFDVEPME